MVEQSHMSIINSSSRFGLEKMGLSAEWYYLPQQQLTTKYFILLGCYQLGGNFISWEEEQFGRAAAVLSGGVCVSQHKVVPRWRRELCSRRDTEHSPNTCSHPAHGCGAGHPCVCRERLLASKAGRAQGGL